MEQIQTNWNPSSFRGMAWTAPSACNFGTSATALQAVRNKHNRYIAARVVEGISLLSMWWSAQTAIWLACGLGGLVLVFLNWLLISRIALLLPRLTEKTPAAECATDPATNDIVPYEFAADRSPVHIGHVSVGHVSQVHL